MVTGEHRVWLAGLMALTMAVCPACDQLVKYGDGHGVASDRPTGTGKAKPSTPGSSTAMASPGGGASGAPSADACTKVSAPLVEVPLAAGVSTGSEPQIRVPKPAGWNRLASLDSKLIRYTMRNEALAANGFTPTAVVTLDSRPGAVLAADVFEQELHEVTSQLGATDLHMTDIRVCGLPGKRATYMAPAMGQLPPRPVKVVSAVITANGQTFDVSVTIQTTEPDNPTYQADSEDILNGLQVLPPPS